jgi:hypothetical protein
MSHPPQGDHSTPTITEFPSLGNLTFTINSKQYLFIFAQIRTESAETGLSAAHHAKLH